MRRDHFEEEHVMFRDAVKRFAAAEIAPHNHRWEKRRGYAIVQCLQLPLNHGFLRAPGRREITAAWVSMTFRYNQILMEEFELAGVGSAGFGHSDAQRHCYPVFPGVLYRTTETEMAARVVLGGPHRRDCHDRARRGI